MPHDERTMAMRLQATAACWGAIAVHGRVKPKT